MWERRLPGWRALGAFWGVLVAVLAAGAGVLQLLGPVAHDRPPITPAQVAQAASGPRVAPPDPALLERSVDFAGAELPRVGANGQAPRIAYAAPAVPVPAGGFRIGLIVSGVGLSEKDTQAAINGLPGPVSLAVSAYASTPPAVLEAARVAGHELLASIPMEPQGFPLDDEGNQSLLTGAPPERNRLNLQWALGRVQGAVGATGASDGMRGERFAELSGAMGPVLDEVERRGLLYIDPRPGSNPVRAGLYARGVDMVIDDPPARAGIEAKLASLERIAREKGSALGLVGRLQPVTLARVAAWIKTLAGRGYVLVPVSSLATAPPNPAGRPVASQ